MRTDALICVSYKIQSKRYVNIFQTTPLLLPQELNHDLADTGHRDPPLVETTWLRLVVIVIAYVLTLGLSGVILRLFSSVVLPGDSKPAQPTSQQQRILRQGMIIGKCENIIAVTLILLGQETGLALIFTAKALVRKENIQSDPGYYLGGTLVNFVWALIVSFVARLLIFGL